MGIAAGVLSLSVLQEILAILASPDYVSSLITGGLLVIVTIVWTPDFSQWFRTTRTRGSRQYGKGKALPFRSGRRRCVALMHRRFQVVRPPTPLQMR